MDNVDVSGYSDDQIRYFYSFSYLHDPVAVHSSFQSTNWIHFCNNHVCAEACSTGSYSTTAPAVTAYYHIFTCNKHVGCSHDCIKGRLAGTVTVVKEVFCVGIIYSHDREFQSSIGMHGLQSVNTCCSLFTSSFDILQ